MFSTMMLGGFVGVMALHPLMSRAHRSECSLRRCGLGENASQEHEQQ
jgi:hypothetical protein